MIGSFAPNQELLVVSAMFAPIRPVCDDLAQVLPIFHTFPWTAQDGIFSFDDCFTGSPPHGGAHKTRVLAFSPEPERFSLIVVNLQSGWSSLDYRLTRDLGTKSLMLGFCSDSFPYPARFFTLLDRGESIRHVAVRFEDEWSFYEEGSPLPQEDTRTYKNRLIKSRLTNEQIIKLAESFGIPLGVPHKISGPGTLFLQS
jgi:hypothetical protein